MIEEQDWAAFSLKNAFADMEDEQAPDYGEADCRKGGIEE